jgi:uroporphyrinogen decarboxylase
MGEFVSEANFHKHALPRMVRIAAELHKRCPGVPLMVFPRGAAYATEALQQVYDILAHTSMYRHNI